MASVETLPQPYDITLVRKHNPAFTNDITFIHLAFGRPRPLADDACLQFSETKKCFEIPVYMTDNKKRTFEGLLTGIADGKPVRVVVDVDLTQETIFQITETSNDSVQFVEKPGATSNW